MRRQDVVLLAAAAAALHVVLGLLALEPAPYVGGDNATYVALAHSILARGDYTEIWDPALGPATLYPPVFPLLLAAPIALGADSWIALKIATLLISGVAVALSVSWLARVSTTFVAAIGGVLIAAMPGALVHPHMVLSEVPFWAFTMLALRAFAGHEHVSAEDEPSRGRRMLLVAAIATALAWLTRSAGVALAVALIVRLLLTRRVRDAALFSAIAVSPVALWWLRGRVLAPHGYARYLLLADPYRPESGRIGVLELIPRALENAGTYFVDLAPRVLAGGPSLLASALLAIALLRWGWRLLHERGAAELWLLFYGGLVLLWPQSWAGERFILPLVPVIVFYVADVVHAVVRRWPRHARVVSGAAVAVAVVTVVPGTVRQVERGITCRSGAESMQPFPCTIGIWRDLFEVAAAARGRLDADAVVISRKPSLFFDISGYRSSVYPWSADPDAFFALVDSVGADYVVLDRSPGTAEAYLVPVLEARPDQFCVVPALSRPLAVLLRIDPAGRRDVSQQGAGAGQTRFRTCEERG